MQWVCPHCQQALGEETLPAGDQAQCPACGHALAAPVERTTSLGPSGRRIGKFELLDELGSGGFGSVWRAYDRELDRLVALKLPHAGRFSSAQDRERFLREGRNAARLRHPNIVSVHEVAYHDGIPYLVTDFVAGVTLGDFLTGRRLSFREAAELAAQVADALAYAHAEKVIHRDIKPSNIMLERATAAGPLPGRPLVMDFGLALREGSEATLTVEGQVLGTPAYMSPEQAAGGGHRADGRSDVYSLGVILFQLLTGELPFRGNARMQLHQVIHDEPRSPRSLNDQVPRDLETICQKAMAKEPSRRYAGAAELRDDLRRWLRGEPILARPVGRAERLWRWYRRNRLVGSLLAAVFVLLAALAVGGAAVAFRERRLAQNERIARALAEQAEKNAEGQAREANEARRQEARAKKRALDSEREAYRRLVQMHVATGVRHMEDGDLFAALPWLAAALAEERDPALGILHRYRLGSLLRTTPRLLHLLDHAGDLIKQAHFSGDGRFVLTVGNSAARLWDLASGKELHRLAHPDLHRAAFSPNSRRIVTAGWDGKARVWDVANGKEVLILEHTGHVQGAAFSPDGRRLLTWGSDGTARLWDLEKAPPVALHLAHRAGVQHAAFSPDGARVVTVDAQGMGRLWDAADGTAPGPVLSVQGPGRWGEFSPDGQCVLVAGGYQAVVADVKSGRILGSIRHATWVYLARFSPDGQSVLTSSLDMTARLSRLNGVSHVEVKHKGAVYFAAFSPDGRRFVTSGEDMTARVWDADTGQPVTPPLEHANIVAEAAFSADGRLLATAGWDGAARVWDLAAGAAEKPRISRTARFWRISPDRRLMATLEANHTVHVWDLDSGKEACPPLAHAAAVYELGFDADGRRLFTNGADGVAHFWDVATGKPAGVPLRHGSGIIRVCLGPDGKRAWTGGEDNQVRCWDLATGREIGPALAHGGAVYWCQLSRDGRRLLTASRQEWKARVWDTATGQPLTPPLPHQPLVERLQDDGPDLSPDGQLVLTHPADFDIQVWDAGSGRAIGPPLRHSGGITSVRFSPDGRRILTTGNDLRAIIWDPATSRPVLSSLRHANWVRDGAFSSDGRLIATAGNDRVARLWDAATGLPLSPPLPHPVGVQQVWLSPDGRRLVTRCQRGGIRVWDVSPDERSPEQWLALAQVLSSHRLDTSDALLPLDAGEMRAAWGTVCANRPADTAAGLPAPLAWQQRQAEDAEEARQWPAADFHWSRLLAEQPDSVPGHLHRARARLQMGRQAEALEDFDWLIAHGQATANLWAGRAAIHSARGQWEKAAADYSRAIAAQGGRAVDWMGRGQALAELERWDEAARDFGRAIELGQATLVACQAHTYACLAAGKRQDFRKARAALLRRFLKGEDFQTAAAIAHLYFFEADAADDLDGLLPILQRAAARNPNTCTYYHVLGPVAYRAGRTEAALKHLNEAVRLHGKGAGLPTDWLFLALAHQQLGHPEEARRWLTRAEAHREGAANKPGAQGAPPGWSQRLELRLLGQEARARIKPPSPAGK